MAAPGPRAGRRQAPARRSATVLLRKLAQRLGAGFLGDPPNRGANLGAAHDLVDPAFDPRRGAGDHRADFSIVEAAAVAAVEDAVRDVRVEPVPAARRISAFALDRGALLGVEQGAAGADRVVNQPA